MVTNMKMKYNIMSIMAIFASVSLLSGCSDFLEKYPQDAMSDQDYFTKDTDLEYYINGLYDGILRSANSFKWSNLIGCPVRCTNFSSLS